MEYFTNRSFRFVIWLFGFLIMSILTGCGGALNPYESEFECPQAEKGKCIGIPDAYKESLEASKNATDYGNYTLSLSERKPVFLSPAEEEYITSLYEVLERLLKDPKTPVVAPPKIVRVLILPYTDESGKNLFSARYSYIVIEEPKWVLENILKHYPPEEAAE